MALAEVTGATIAKHGGIAFFGALVHALNAHRGGQTKSALDILTLTVISSFSGVMFAFLGLHFFGEGSYLTLALSGAGGFLGVEGMGIIVKMLKKTVEANIR